MGSSKRLAREPQNGVLRTVRTRIPLIAASIAILLGGTLGADDLSYYEKILTEKNIETDSDGLNEYLSGLHPNEQQRQRVFSGKICR